MHRKQAELEERIQQRLRDAERERQLEIRKVKVGGGGVWYAGKTETEQ